MKLKIIFIHLFVFTSFLFSQSKTQNINDLLSKYHDYGLLNGSVLVADNGKIILKKGYGFANIEHDISNSDLTVHRIGSITKQFTSAVIMQLVEEGKVKLNDKITTFIQDYRKDTGDKISVHHLLTHTSGIPSYTSYPGFWTDSSRNPYSLDKLIKIFCNGDFEFEPGSEFAYSNSGYVLLAKIIEEVTGKSYEQNINERIFTKIGMTSSYLERPGIIIKNRASGYDKLGVNFANTKYMNVGTAIGAGDIASTVNDLYLWDQALYTNKILSEESKKKIFTPFKEFYGYGWGISKIDNPSGRDSLTVYSHSGGINGFNSYIARIVDNQQLIVILNNTGSAPLGEMKNKIIQILYDHDYEYPPKPVGKHIYEIIEEEGIDNAISSYKALKKEEGEIFTFNEAELNMLGYSLLGNNRLEEAIKIFQLNIEEYPESYNTYDSMGEAYMKKGNNELAIKNYKKSIEMNPQNLRAYITLKELGVNIEPPKDVEVSQATLDKYVGKYELFPNFIITVTTEKNKLFAHATGQNRFQIFPEKENLFYYKVVPAKIEFIKDKNRSVNKIILYQNNQEMPAKRIE